MPSEAELLGKRLARLSLSFRLYHWAEQNGVRTLRDLAVRDPAELLAARNIGHGTVDEARRLIEGTVGRRWEDLVHADLAVELEPGSWDAVRRDLTPEQRATVLDDLELPWRLRAYARNEELVTLGDLATRSEREIERGPNRVFRGADRILRAVAKHAEMREADHLLMGLGLRESFRQLVAEADPLGRLVLARRSGLEGTPATVLAIADELDVSRGRVSQITRRACAPLARRPWGREVRRRFRAALRPGGVPLSELEGQPFWQDAVRTPGLVAFIANVLLRCAVVSRVAGQLWMFASG